MSGDGRPVLKISKWLRIILLVVLLVAIATIVLSRMTGSRPGRSVLSEMFDNRSAAVSVGELNFEVGRSRVFAHADGSVAAAGTLGLQVLGPDGRETLRGSFRISAPALAESGGRFLAFDIGGTAIRVFDPQSIISSIETEAPIVSASINSNGWHCVVTQAQTGGSRGTVDVYNSSGRHVYQIVMGSGFVLSAKLSDNNRNLAVLTIAETGSRVTVYAGIDTDKDDPDSTIELGSDIFLEISYLSNTALLAFGTQSAVTFDIEAEHLAKTLCSFDGKRLGGYTYTDSFAAVHLYDYNIGYSGQLVTFDYDGEVLGRLGMSQEVASMASCGNTLMILGSDGVEFYDKGLAAYPLADSGDAAATTGRVLALSEDMVLTANDLSAIVIRRSSFPTPGE